MVVQETFAPLKKCSICRLSDIDCVNYGEIHATKELAVHLFCLYFSTDLPQRGSDNAGIVGFELRDIRKLLKECVEVKCFYCDQGSATTHCYYPNCSRVFHQVCGFKANARFEYVDNFRSFCDEHNHIENETMEYPVVAGCFLCYEALGDYHPVTTVPSCCVAWFHQQCIRTYAVNAGYAFMCPTCRNKEGYADSARRHGVYVPEYEALWEKTHDYRDIERFYTHCDSKDCLCPHGREFTNDKWSLQLCSCCGGYGLHKLCRPKSERDDIVICDVCVTVERRQQTDEPEMIEPPLQPQLPTDGKSQRNSNENVGVSIDLIDTTPPLRDRNLPRNSNAAAEEAEMVIDLTGDDILEKNIASSENVEETLDEKYAREKAERPVRDEMRDYRISLWFRDYRLYKQSKHVN